MMQIRRLHPHIERIAVKKKHKKYSAYKENARAMAKRNPQPAKKYSELSEKSRTAIKKNSMRHSLAASAGKTKRMRAIRRRKRREYLRIKYKLQNRTKVCTICKIDKALSDFDMLNDKNHTKRYRRTYCHVCRRDMNAAAYIRRRDGTGKI